MSVTVEILNPLEGEGWNDAVRPMGGANVFHSAEWAATLRDAYGFDPLYLVARDGPALRDALPLMAVNSPFTGKRGVSLPFTDICPPLHRPGDEGAVAALVEAAHALAGRSRWKYVEWRSGVAIAPHATVYQRYLAHTLPLHQDPARLLAGFKSPIRTAIRKAEAAGLTVTLSTSIEDLQAFYRLHGMTRRDHGLPPPPYAFFRALHRHLFAGGMGRVALAKRDGQAIAGAVFLNFGQDVMFKYGASDKRHQALRGSNLVMWEAMRQYGLEGYRTLHLGRTSPNHEGLLRFKRAWGATESDIHYYRFEPATARFIAGNDEQDGAINRIFRHLPLPLLRRCGQLLYKHIA